MKMKIVVFDSGLGSLSIIKAIQKRTKADIIYLADKKNIEKIYITASGGPFLKKNFTLKCTRITFQLKSRS